LSVDGINVGTVFFQQKSDLLVSSEDGIMQRSESFIILFVDPFFFGAGGVFFRLFFNHLVIPLKQILSEFVVGIVGGNVEH